MAARSFRRSLLSLLTFWKKARNPKPDTAQSAQAKITLRHEQIEALLDLQADYAQRSEEMKKHFPELAFSIERLYTPGTDWEWFPKDTEKLPADGENYIIVSHEGDAPPEQLMIRVLRPGIRSVGDRKALVKAKISVHHRRKAGEATSLLDDLNNL
ncbi:hypothetical protein [Paenibacillus turpanensis]|uniref:hypothetical protein n=1 Tax=Paenibacillus turpanensis TaxID=2689078 RepID=UPI00140C96A0|nr:hypothetical protein [Paenibacillus turpanensis]